MGLSDINISKDTNKIIANYNKIDDNSFEIICYTDNVVYESKIEDDLQIKENQSIEKSYKGNYFYISGSIFIHTTKDGTGTGNITYEIINSNNVVIETVNFLNIPPTKYETKSVSKLLRYDEIVTFKLKMTTYRHGPATIRNSFSIFGGTKKSGSILGGKAEWLAYEN